MGNSSDEESEAGETGDLYGIGRSTKSSNQAGSQKQLFYGKDRIGLIHLASFVPFSFCYSHALLIILIFSFFGA